VAANQSNKIAVVDENQQPGGIADVGGVYRTRR
jgi:hypothetical protein